MEQAAILGDEEEDQPVDEVQQLAEEVGDRHFARLQTRAQRRILQEAGAEGEERRLEAAAQPLAGGDALLGAGLAPVLERAIGDGGTRGSKAGRMDQEPQRREIGKGLVLEHAGEIGLDIGGAGKALIVADETQGEPVGAEAPERALLSVEPVLDGGGCGAAAAIAGELLGGLVDTISRRHHHDGRAPAQRLEGDGECPFPEGALADAGDVGKAEDVAQQLLDEFHRREVGWRVASAEGLEQGLPDAEVARHLLTQGHALRDLVFGLLLAFRVGRGDAGQHGGGDERALEAQRVEGERGRFLPTRHLRPPPGRARTGR